MVNEEMSKQLFSDAYDIANDIGLGLFGCQYYFAVDRALSSALTALSAVLCLDGFSSDSEQEVISEFDKLYIKTGKFDLEVLQAVTYLYETKNRYENCEAELSAEQAADCSDKAKYIFCEVAGYLKYWD